MSNNNKERQQPAERSNYPDQRSDDYKPPTKKQDYQFNSKKKRFGYNLAVNTPQILQMAIDQKKNASMMKEQQQQIPKNNEPFVLDARSTDRSKQYKKWLNNIEKHIQSKFQKFSNEIKDPGELVPNPVQPFEPDLAAYPQAQRPLISSKYVEDYRLYQQKVDAMEEKRLQIVGEIRKYLSETIEEDVLQRCPNYSTQPNLIEFMKQVKVTYNSLVKSGGRSIQTEQLIESQDTAMFTGITALENAKRNGGEFDLHEHKEDFLQLESDREAIGLTPRLPIEQAKRFIFSLCLIASRYLILVNTYQQNEAVYYSMPKHTPEQRETADKFRMMPKTLMEAYNLALQQQDLHLVTNNPVLKASHYESNNSGASFATVDNRGAGSNNKGKKNRGANVVKTGGAVNDDGDNDPFCVICDKHTHSTTDCRFLPQAALAWKLQKNKKAGYTSNTNDDNNNNLKVQETTTQVKKNNVNKYFNTKYYDEEEDVGVYSSSD